MSFRSLTGAIALGLVALGSLGSTEVAAQGLPLQPMPNQGLPIIPIMEGWWDDGDGSFTISFGYSNRNREVIEIPIGQSNLIEPASLSGAQPTAFLTGRQHGVFTVTIPAGMRDPNLMWTIQSNGQTTNVPGHAVSSAYMLDKIPRPHGTVPPLVRFEENGEAGQHPPGITSKRVETVKVGELLPLTIWVEDPSVRDPADYRFKEPLAIAISWFKHQGPPGTIEWVRDPSTPLPAPPAPAAGAAAGGTAPAAAAPARLPPGNQVTVANGKGKAIVQARFPVPGEYVVRVRADQFSSAPDSGAGDQCCWTNGYVRVRVTP